MPKVTLGEVAAESKETCKGDKSGYPVVGLEHITPGDITLTNWAENDENTFTKLFRKGDMLFGRRRAYLKKAAVAPFDGICSGDITVIRALPDKIVPELLPFIIQSEDFFDFAVGRSAGSLSPRVKWEHLKTYSFTLPSLEKQRELAEVLWAIEDTRTAYQRLEQATDELVKARFIEMFGAGKFPDVNIDEVCSDIVDCPHTTPKYQGKLLYPAIRTNEIKPGYIDWSTMKYVSIEEYEKRIARLTPIAGDIVYGREGTYGNAAILPEGYNFCLGQRVMLFRVNRYKCLPEYLLYALTSDDVKKQADSKNTGSTVPHVNVADARKFTISLPPLDLQNQFAAFVEQVDKSKLAVQSMLEKNAVMKAAAMREWLG